MLQLPDILILIGMLLVLLLLLQDMLARLIQHLIDIAVGNWLMSYNVQAPT